YCVDPTTVFALFDASSSGAIRRLSAGSAEDFTNFAVDGSTITFADNFVHTPDDGDLSSRADIRIVDLSATAAAPRTLVAGAYSFYFPTGDRRAVVYSWDRDPANQGLFVLRVR